MPEGATMDARGTAALSVAAIIPVYNGERFLKDALESVAAQRHAPDELIVVNDGSTDGTVAVVEKWADQHWPGLKLVHRENGGLAGARNTGIEHAESDLIALLDADDLWHPQHLEMLLRGFREHPDLALFFGDAQSVTMQGRPIRRWLPGSEIEKLPYCEENGIRLIQGSAYRGVVGGSRIANCSTLISKTAAVEAGLYDERFRNTQDREFWLRLSRVGQFGYVPQLLSTVRRHGDNLTDRKNRVRNRFYKFQVVEKALAHKEELRLTAEEIGLTKAARRKALRSLLYNASIGGLRNYSSCCLNLLQRGYLSPLLSPMNFVRSLVHPDRPVALPWTVFDGHDAYQPIRREVAEPL